MEIPIIAGWTGRLDFQLLSSGIAQSIDTGDVLSAYVRDRNGCAVTSSTSALTIISSASGHVGFSPCTSSLLVAGLSPYTFRVHFLDTASKVVFFPNADAVALKVRSA